jgi:AraC-like DNA-binding protein/transcriptional regulator with XRE-family HTH domain
VVAEKHVPGSRRALGGLLVEARLAARGGKGLSVEEAADRAGVGASWYRWLEDGRNIGLSAITLNWVADALGIVGAARDQLLHTANLAEEPPLTPLVEPVRPSTRRLLESIVAHPAYLLGRRGDLLAWNEATEAVYRCHLIPATRRNTYMFLFAQPDVRKLIVNWDSQARQQIAELRAMVDQTPRDPVLNELKRTLAAMSPDFQFFWRNKMVEESKQKIFHHPRVGRLSFEVETLFGDGGQHTRFYVPFAEDGTEERMARLVRLHRRDARNAKRSAQQQAVRRVKAHLEECYAREVPLDELAALVGMDRYALVRTFAAEVGYPPHAYQMLVRVFQARRLLREGTSGAEVALAVGFTDQSHLIRHFRRLEGSTPAEFLRRAKLYTTPNGEAAGT